MYSYSAPQLRLESEWVVAFDVDAATPEDAARIAQQQLLPPFLAALNTLGPEPYRVELLAVESVGEPRESHPVFSPFAAFGFQWVNPMEPADHDTLVARWDAMTRDRVAREAGANIARGVALKDLSGAESSASAVALLQHYLALERVVQAVGKRLRASGRAEEQKTRERIAVEFMERLSTAAGDAERASLVEEAARELRRAALLVAEVQIRRAGAELRVAPDVIEDAVAFAKFRSDALGHGGDPTAAELQRWGAAPDHRAFAVANTFLVAYIDWAAGA